MATAVETARLAYPGEFVFYYPSGLREGPRHLVIVDESYESGIIRASHIKQRMPQIVSSVRHVDDPHLAAHPEQRPREGAWDFHPAHRLVFDMHHQEQNQS